MMRGPERGGRPAQAVLSCRRHTSSAPVYGIMSESLFGQASIVGIITGICLRQHPLFGHLNLDSMTAGSIDRDDE
jgi:hypothetical protein